MSRLLLILIVLIILIPIGAHAVTILDQEATKIYDWRNKPGTPGYGDWRADVTYHRFNWVKYGGSTWRSIQDSNLHNIPKEGAWWTEETNTYIQLSEYRSGITYSIDEWVYIFTTGGPSTTYYRSLQKGNLGHDPFSSPSWWEEGIPPTIALDLFDIVNGWPLRWSSWIGGILALKGTCFPDQWAEEEVDAGNLGPAVRVDAKNDSMYFISMNRIGPPGEATIYAQLYRRNHGTNTLLHGFLAGYDGPGIEVPQAAKLGVTGNPPVLHVAVRNGRSGQVAGYDPFELQIRIHPWVYLGSYTDTDNDKLIAGVPGLWNPVPKFKPGDEVFDAEHTSHWSYYCAPQPGAEAISGSAE